MSECNVKSRTIFAGKNCDNLRVMRGINSDSIDLIATDPPFNAKRSFNAPLGSKAAGQKFDDTWKWDDVVDDWYDLLHGEHDAVKEVIEAAAVIEGGSVDYEKRSISTGKVKNSIAAYLCFMAPRLLEMRRILKPTGSIYLHCDSAANSYLRLLMDAVFGRKNFRNEIVWCYTGPANVKKNLPRKHDAILFYAMSDDTKMNLDAIRVPYKQRMINEKSTGGKKSSTRQIFREGHDVDRLNRLYERGKIPEDYWVDINPCTRNSSERTGWATQKPVALYERIIKASSNPGDVVFDPFCGCSTTMIAAHNLGRKWIGCDIDEKASEVLDERMAMATLHQERATPKKHPPTRKDIKQPSDKEMRVMIHSRQDGRCRNPYCKHDLRVVDMELDHFIAKSRGGDDALHNRIGLCSTCNRRKGKKSWDEFQHRERERQAHPTF